MLQIFGLNKSFRIDGRSLPILDIPAWQVEKGEKVAITGPSGSGKSTLLHLISGIAVPDKGEIHLEGQPLHTMTEAQRDRLRSLHIGYVLQDFHLIPSLTASQNIEIAMGASMPAKRRKTLISEWLERVGLADRAKHMPSQLSRGQQQRVAIVRALVNNPPLLLADEPTGSLDWETADEISRLLLDLSSSGQQTLIVVTHDLNMAERFPKCLDIRELNRVRKHTEHQAGRGGAQEVSNG
ncbi:putative ABC transport system ATP-binding protein [Paenibacillus sophorae]|uniref:ABC transporter ATP-binding protein n=1 Tax=Paenibacillus sophorae TaxID=1333845 RepID=A0A1H8HY18_9BACL|nr:ABC transporter ATP-binding protein [Paenibacillus sophorae]QWU15793.1 ABC transporter ATP-binding protein [Paenibacillus sophorae]SEN61149.1 putative ABC transport system ATP-binding protein [Paenibacillus sophorae]